MSTHLNGILAGACVVAGSGLALADNWCASGTAAIPDDGQSSCVWSVDVDVPADHLVSSVRVFVSAEHPWVGDLIIRMQTASGFWITLLDRPGLPDGGWVGPWGCGGDNLSVFFDDSASTAAEDTCTQFDVPVISGNRRPIEPLGELYAESAAGLWRIEFRDVSPIDAGTVSTVCVTLETSPDCNGNGVPDVDDIAGGQSDDADGDGVPDECDCVGDLDGDAIVDVNDLLILIGQFGGPGSADLDGDGLVDADDLLIVLGAWGACS
jgi:subtilisin-like proprotein convertase family protein